jgi:hypothetical protein
MKSILALIVLVLAVLITGVVLQDLWLWFVVPLGAVAIGQWHAMGLATIIRLCTFSISKDEIDNEVSDKVTFTRYVAAIAVPLFMWGLGWIYHTLMIG